MKTCASCGAENPEDAAFCSKCGYAFTPQEERPSTAAPSAANGQLPQPPMPGMPYGQPPPGYPPQAPMPGMPYGQPPPGYPPQAPMPGMPYGQPVYVQPAAGRSNGKATGALVTGIIGVLVFPIIFSVLAIILGAVANREIDASGGWQTGKGNALAGIILGIVGLVSWFVILVMIYG